MKSSENKKMKRPMSLTKKIVLCLVGIAAVSAIIYLLYYVFHYVLYDKYEDYLTSYEYETGTAYAPLSDSGKEVKGMDLIAENDILKLYTDTKTGYIAIYDKRDGSITYSNPENLENDQIANKSNLNYLRSAFILTYYNEDVKSATYDSYSYSVERGQMTFESIENGIRYIYRVGELKAKDGSDGISFEIPVEYRLDGDSITVSIPASGIKEYGKGSVARIQLLRYMGAGHNTEAGYLVVPNGSGSLINFNNEKLTAASYSQYIYGIDPMAANYTLTENVTDVKLPIAGICREDRSVLLTVEDGATSALFTAGISGVYNEYNYLYPTFVLRNVDNLRMFGNATQDIYILEEELYDMNMQVRYTFLNDEYTGYAGLANYYREKLIAEGVLTPMVSDGNIPFYYDIIAGVKETSHFLGVQYLRTFSMTEFEEAAMISEDLEANGITNQVMNLQGWFNGGYYHDAADKINVTWGLGGKSDLEDLQRTLTANNGRLYLDVAFQQVTFADDGFNYGTEGSRYYGAGYVASFGLVDPTTLRATSGLGYMEPQYDLLSPKYLPRYVEKFAKKVQKIDVEGISLRDLADYLHSDKKRTNVITREEALDVVLGQFEILEATEKKMMLDASNAYAFEYASDIINAPITHNEYLIVDESIPLYEMIIHGCIPYSTELLNYDDSEDMTLSILQAIEAGAAPHYVFTWEESSLMKNTGMNSFYATTYETWKEEAIEVYGQVNEALKYVSGSQIIDHEIMDNDVRKVTYDNGVIIYINYSEKTQNVDGQSIPAMSYRMEGN